MSLAPPPLPVFLVDDNADVRSSCEQSLFLANIPVQSFTTAEDMLEALLTQTPSLIISDVRLPGMDGLTLLRHMHQHQRSLPVILITGHGDVGMAVDALREGAYDFIEKPFPAERLVTTVNSALEKRALILENQQLKQSMGQATARLIGQSPAIQQIRRLIDNLAPTGVDILINGETGSGKEEVARAIHQASGRLGPFVAINCGALPESVFESELFGHEAGAFTGANKRRIGRIEHASGGTLFLDEIESMPLNLQVKLLRVLQERSIERLGSNLSIAVDCRLVAASKGDLKILSEAGQFRSDLYYRINVASMDLPPLRKRREDIALLMNHFLQEASRRYQRPLATWTPADMARWTNHDWPGNVRELKNTAERWALELPDTLTPIMSSEGTDPSLAAQIEATERMIIENSLRQCQGNIAQTAELLQTPKKTLYDKILKHKIVARQFRPAC